MQTTKRIILMYDGIGNMTKMKTANGHNVTRKYAVVGNTEVNKAAYQYSVTGNLIKSENINGRFEMFYDSNNRLYKTDICQGSAHYYYNYNYNIGNNRGLVSNKYLYRATGVNGINEDLISEHKYTYDSVNCLFTIYIKYSRIRLV